MTDDFHAFIDQIETGDPADRTALLVFADWCDEHEKPDFAYALRWCAGRGRRPYKRHDVIRYPWQWVREQKTYRGMTKAELRARSGAILPQAVFDAMKEPGEEGMITFSYRDLKAAYEYLSRGLSRLREAVAYPDLPPAVPRKSTVDLTTCPACGLARSAKVEACPVCVRG